VAIKLRSVECFSGENVIHGRVRSISSILSACASDGFDGVCEGLIGVDISSSIKSTSTHTRWP
jgi:hypothetical protein